MGMHYRWFERDEEQRTDDYGMPLSRAELDKEEREENAERIKHRKITSSEWRALMIAGAAIIYAAVKADIALVLLALSFLVYESRALTYHFPVPHADAIRNGMRAFSIALFFGTIAYAFLL